MDNSGGMTLTDLLEQPGVVEEVELRGDFGFLAFHGGPVERVTSLIARMAAERSGASFYSIDQPAERPLHLPSTRFDPAESPKLAAVLDHVRSVCTVHGYGREMSKQYLLLGGQNRHLATRLANALRRSIRPKYRVIDDLDEIPRELRGVHPRNPVNVPSDKGVQLELPPGIRWNWPERSWADADGLEPTLDVLDVVDALAATAVDYMRR